MLNHIINAVIYYISYFETLILKVIVFGGEVFGSDMG